MNKYRVIITDNQGNHSKGKRFEKVYEIPDKTKVIDYLLYHSSLINDLQDFEINIPDMKWEVYFESQIEINDQKTLNLELQNLLIENELNFNPIQEAIHDALNEIGLTYDLGELPPGIKSTILDIISANL